MLFQTITQAISNTPKYKIYFHNYYKDG